MIVKIFKKQGDSFSFKKRARPSKQVLEDEINDWLSANPKVKIKDIKQSCCGGSLEPSLTVISVWYEPK